MTAATNYQRLQQLAKGLRYTATTSSLKTALDTFTAVTTPAFTDVSTLLTALKAYATTDISLAEWRTVEAIIGDIESEVVLDVENVKLDGTTPETLLSGIVGTGVLLTTAKTDLISAINEIYTSVTSTDISGLATPGTFYICDVTTSGNPRSSDTKSITSGSASKKDVDVLQTVIECASWAYGSTSPTLPLVYADGAATTCITVTSSGDGFAICLGHVFVANSI